MVDADASDQVVVVVLLQSYKLRPVAYFNKMYCSAERNYPLHKKKILAVFEAC